LFFCCTGQLITLFIDPGTSTVVVSSQRNKQKGS
jgi:hypothetical protein